MIRFPECICSHDPGLCTAHHTDAPRPTSRATPPEPAAPDCTCATARFEDDPCPAHGAHEPAAPRDVTQDPAYNPHVGPVLDAEDYAPEPDEAERIVVRDVSQDGTGPWRVYVAGYGVATFPSKACVEQPREFAEEVARVIRMGVSALLSDRERAAEARGRERGLAECAAFFDIGADDIAKMRSALRSGR